MNWLCDRGYGRASGRPRTSNPATYCPHAPQVRAPAVAQLQAHLHSLVTPIHETSGLEEFTMPIYEYQCQECGAISEKLLVGGESGTDICCSHCGSQRVDRILSVASLFTKKVTSSAGHTCCGQEERCDTLPCSSGGSCRRD